MLNRINAAELHQRVGEILAKIRYTGSRYIIERRGIPVAAVVSIEDLERLQRLGATPPRAQSVEDQIAALERAAAVRRLILTQRHGKLMPSSAETIRRLREERTRHVAGLR
jgi:prevent-host-death family protein